ncbi:FAD-linked oxidoreductase [Saccharomonospora piscinae]|uniref:FAD-linked oxidoreductase n=1 Tax=Saccharomonospora piscinae TaxID=687388 RepID=A0A1V8ZXU8_SACPI|nr:FAD-binding oxidoreductase [Saccharomonospora piscinae]OQO89630.1 FAD-linked oxidoreductase [Saccharomonospora piscinae]
MTGTQHLSTSAARWARHLRGAVTEPANRDYGDTLNGFQSLRCHEPALVVHPADTDDVRAAVALAAAEGTRIAVQATGHGLAFPLRGEGLLIDTSALTGVRVNPTARTAWVEAGATWQHVIDAAAPHGLAPLSGSLPGVGAVSYTLGGGVGLLARRYGFAADHVRRLDLVTADGTPHQVTATSEPDLFWALRGAGSNFGVVTSMEIDLVPVTTLYGGGLFFDLHRVPSLARQWHEWTSALPDELTSALALLPFPDSPTAPEPLRGRHVGQIQISFLGTQAAGAALLEPLRALGPVLDTVREIPYAESGAVFAEPDRPHAYRGESLLLPDLDADALTTATADSAPGSGPPCVIGFRHLGGALARQPDVANAVGHRDAAYTVGTVSPVGPGELTAVRARHHDMLAPWRPLALGRALNFTFDDLAEDDIDTAFSPGDRGRLRRLRARHDPHGLLRPAFPLGR